MVLLWCKTLQIQIYIILLRISHKMAIKRQTTIDIMKRSDFEIMAPVGSYESLQAALQAGADSVYFGIEGLNMRARSSVNFTHEDLKNIVQICKEHNVKTYLTVKTNI